MASIQWTIARFSSRGGDGGWRPRYFTAGNGHDVIIVNWLQGVRSLKPAAFHYL